MSAVLLALAGVLAIYGVFIMVNAPATPSPVWTRVRCDSTSPDGVYRCTLDMAHTGWCENGDIEWRYEAWAIGSDDYTRAANPPIVIDDDTEQVTVRTRRIPRPVFWAGIILVAGAANFAYDTTHPVVEKPTPHCDWTGVACENWTTTP